LGIEDELKFDSSNFEYLETKELLNFDKTWEEEKGYCIFCLRYFPTLPSLMPE